MFIFTDVAQGLLEFREVRANAKVIMELLSTRQTKQRTNDAKSPGLLAMILYVTRNPKSSRLTSLGTFQLRACLPHPHTIQQEKQLQVLVALSIYGRDILSSRRRPSFPPKRICIRWLHPQFVNNSAIVPVSCSFAAASPPATEDCAKSVETSKKLVEVGQQLLFHCEYLALVDVCRVCRTTRVRHLQVDYRAVPECRILSWWGWELGDRRGRGSARVYDSRIRNVCDVPSIPAAQVRVFSLYQFAFVFETQISLVQVSCSLRS